MPENPHSVCTPALNKNNFMLNKNAINLENRIYKNEPTGSTAFILKGLTQYRQYNHIKNNYAQLPTSLAFSHQKNLVEIFALFNRRLSQFIKIKFTLQFLWYQKLEELGAMAVYV